MKVVVVGATGYIGKPLHECAARSTIAHGTSSRPGALLPLRLEAPDDFEYELIDDSTVIFLTAAISAPDECSRDPEGTRATNVTGTSRFISRAIGRGGRVVFFSSDTVYGERTEPADETAQCNPSGTYARMKAEVEGRFLGDSSFKTIRLSYVFSRDDKFTQYLAGAAARGEEAEVFHPFYRAVVHRHDVVQGVMALARRWEEFPQGVINFGGPHVLSREEFAEMLRQEALPQLRFRIARPEASFFLSRPQVIQMVSPFMQSLLGRPARALQEAIRIEFGK